MVQTQTTKPITASDPIDIIPDTLEMSLIPAGQEKCLSPFANLEEQRIINACKRDRAFQDATYRIHHVAKVIICRYYLHDLTKEQSIALLALYCKRSRLTALANIEKSAYALRTTDELCHALFTLTH